jgi:hypothetical protein
MWNAALTLGEGVAHDTDHGAILVTDQVSVGMESSLRAFIGTEHRRLASLDSKCLGSARAELAGFVGTICPMTRQSKSTRTAAKCFDLGGGPLGLQILNRGSDEHPPGLAELVDAARLAPSEKLPDCLSIDSQNYLVTPKLLSILVLNQWLQRPHFPLRQC